MERFNLLVEQVFRWLSEKLELFRYVLVFLFFIGWIWLMNRPCVLRPFSKHNCYCEGYRDGYEKYPDDPNHCSRN